MKKSNILKNRILLSAYACEPHRGSEPGVGWNWMLQISRFHEVWVITRANNRPVIEAEMGRNPQGNVHFLYYDLPAWLKFWKRGNRGVHLYYYLWQIGIYFVVKKLHRRVGFDIVQHVTFVNYWMPSFLALLPVRFVWGPVGGGDSTPELFLKTLSWRGRLYETARNLACRIFEWDPFVRLTARRSRLALAVTENTARRVRSLGAKRVELLSQVGLSAAEIAALPDQRSNSRANFRMVSVGNLLHLKGYHLALSSFGELLKSHPESEYWLVGDGPERRRLEAQAQALGINGRVRFWGKQPRTEVLQKLAECDVLVHPSLHDSGAIVCAEAMGAGLPVVCLDLGGPALQVTDDTGFKIAAKSPDQTVADMAAALGKLAGSVELRRQMGEAGRQRVRDFFGWEEKGELMNRYYRELLETS